MATLLQTDQEGRLQYLKQRIAEYGWRFPGSAITKGMNVTKGHVSRLLKGEVPITDKFLEEFNNAFPGNSENNYTTITQPLQLAATGTPDKNLYERLLEEKEARRQDAEARLEKMDKMSERLMYLLELNSGTILKIAVATLSELKGSISFQAEKEAKGDKKKIDEILTRVSTLTGDHMEAILQAYKLAEQSK